MKKKECTYCGETTHKSWMCFKKPRLTNRPKSAIKRYGKQTAAWLETRNEWIRNNPPEDGHWNCHYCGVPLFLDSTAGQLLTLDHIISRSSAPSKRHDHSNLVPCCNPCNVLKGSMSYERFCQRYFPHLLDSVEF